MKTEEIKDNLKTEEGYLIKVPSIVPFLFFSSFFLFLVINSPSCTISLFCLGSGRKNPFYVNWTGINCSWSFLMQELVRSSRNWQVSGSKQTFLGE